MSHLVEKIKFLIEVYEKNIEEIFEIRENRIKRQEFDSSEELTYLDGQVRQLQQSIIDLGELLK